MRPLAFVFLLLGCVSFGLAGPDATNYVPDFADGAGTALDPYTNWTDAFAASTTVVFTPGWYELPAAGAGNIPDSMIVRCESATIVWPSSRTAESTAFTIPSTSSNVVIEGCTFAPGRTVDPVNGHSDGGGAYIAVGTYASQTQIAATLVDNSFGPGVLNTNLAWRHVYVLGGVNGLQITRNTFDFADRAIAFHQGSNSSPSWTYENVVATQNVFAYSEPKGQNEERWWQYFGSPYGYRTNPSRMKSVTFSDNVMTGHGAMGLRLNVGFDSVMIANNVVSASNFDILLASAATDTAGILRSRNLVVSGNTCYGSGAVCDIIAGKVDTATITGNSLVSNNLATHTIISAGASTNVSISGNALRWIGPPIGGGAAVYIGDSVGVNITGNAIIDPPPAGIRLASGPSSVLVANNLFTNTGSDDSKLSEGVFWFDGSGCTDCAMLNNVVHDISGGTEMFGGTVPSTITDIGNMGGERGFAELVSGVEAIALGGIASLAVNELQTESYDIEFPVIPSSADGQVLTYKESTGRSYWLTPGMVEDVFGETFCQEASNACNDLHDRWDINVAAAGTSAEKVYTFPTGTKSGFLRGWFGTSGCPGCNCTDAEVYLQYDAACLAPPACSWTTLKSFAGDERFEHYAATALTNQDLSQLAVRLLVDSTDGGGKCNGVAWQIDFSEASQTLIVPQKDLDGDGAADISIPVYIEEAGQGVIFTSPDGSCSKCTVGNNDKMSCVSVPCP